MKGFAYVHLCVCLSVCLSRLKVESLLKDWKGLDEIFRTSPTLYK